MRPPPIRWCAGILAAAFLAAPAAAQDSAAPGALTGTLRKVRDSGTLVIGHRVASVPFSFLDKRGQPVGYSIDLCHEVVEAVAEELGVAQVAVAWRPVTPETRIGAVASGEVDLECGSTTSNAERQKQVAFSPIFFLAGTKLLVLQASPVRSLRDLAGKTVVATAGTTNEAAVRSLSERQSLGIRVATAPDHATSFAQVAAGSADAFASDDVLLYGFVATAANGAGFRVAGDYLSYDPYGLMYRRHDPAFAAVVERTFGRLAETRRLRDLYARWFLRRLPNGQQLGIPLSQQLDTIFRALGEPE